MFDLAFDRLIGHEKGFQNDRNDRGNWTSGKIGVGELKGTKYGVSAMSYPHLDIENLTLAEAKEIWRVDFWEANSCDELPGPVAWQMTDAAYHHGGGNATRFLQRAVGVAADGYIGPMTLGAVADHSLTDILMRFNAERLDFMTRVTGWPKYSRGWARRIAGNLKYGAVDT